MLNLERQAAEIEAFLVRAEPVVVQYETKYLGFDETMEELAKDLAAMHKRLYGDQP